MLTLFLFIMRGYYLFALLFFVTFIPYMAAAQTDSLYFENDEFLVGELKSLHRGVVTFKTGFSDSDFKVDWDDVYQIKSHQSYLVSLTNGRRLKATINSIDDVHVIIDDGINPFQVELNDVVALKAIDEKFWDRFSASIDMGFNLTKANNLVQYNARLYTAYLTEKWEIAATLNTVFSSQDSVQDTRRMDANIQLKKFFAKDWFIAVTNDFLKNDEQKLDLRSTSKIGIGNFLIANNSLYLTVFAGAAYNNETYIENANPDRQSAEAYGGFEFNMFDAGDISILTNTIAYPSITEQGRVRVDFKFDIKYDLPLDFYVKAGSTVNYDNRPVAGAADFDYVIQTGLGWEW